MHTKRLSGLDTLRGITAVSGVLCHFNSYYGHRIDTGFTPSFSFPLGSYGVDLFFVASGFVVFVTLERAATLRGFAVSRFARRYPAFWVVVGIAITARLLDGRLIIGPGGHFYG